MFLDTLCQYLHKTLTRYPEALYYLKSRSVTDADITRYGLGYSRVLSVPDDGSQDYVRFMEECDRGRKYENKIVFPLRDMMGGVIGIVGRAIDNKEYKIWASDRAKMTGFFFGLFEALPHIYSENKVFVVEGTFDTVAFSKAFPNTVGALTSGINDVQYNLLRFFCDTIITVFDSDKAGQRGASKAEEKYSLCRVYLGYKDPATILEKMGLDKFRTFVNKKVTDSYPLFLK